MNRELIFNQRSSSMSIKMIKMDWKIVKQLLCMKMNDFQEMTFCLSQVSEFLLGLLYENYFVEKEEEQYHLLKSSEYGPDLLNLH